VPFVERDFSIWLSKGIGIYRWFSPPRTIDDPKRSGAAKQAAEKSKTGANSVSQGNSAALSIEIS
jgi:hypothetical protein